MRIHHLGIRGKCYNFNEKKGVRQGCPLSSNLFNLFINDIFNNCDKSGISIGDDKRCWGAIFTDDIVLCVPTRSQPKKLLKFASKRARNNEMQFGINKC